MYDIKNVRKHSFSIPFEKCLKLHKKALKRFKRFFF